MINLKNKNILVVEDDELNFIYVSQVLKLTGCNIKWIKTGLYAIEYIRAKKLTDLVILDIQLPDMNGGKVASGIRESGFRGPIIAQTASHAGNDMDKLTAFGCNDLIIKPFSIDDLIEKLTRFLAD